MVLIKSFIVLIEKKYDYLSAGSIQIYDNSWDLGNENDDT
jgi:hypothetical protein